MKKLIIIYDDTILIPEKIKTIIGNKSFGDIILKRKTLFSRVEESILDNMELKKINSKEDFKSIDYLSKDANYFHILANEAIKDFESFKVLLEKLTFLNDNITIESSEHIVGIGFCNKDKYKEFLEEYQKTNQFTLKTKQKIETNIFLDLSDYNNLLLYISSGFDARFFNSLQGDNYTVTKKSQDKNKMKMEYNYYWLLPEEMKNWMVMPYNYKEFDDFASYTMERMAMTDIAIRWTNNAIDVEEFNKIMDKIFYFFKIRKSKEVEKEEYLENANKLYLEKVDERILKLKNLREYDNIRKLILSGTEYNTIDDIIMEYKLLYSKITNKLYKKIKCESVIGHGDVFFANMLYSKEINLLRLIDPKGALEEKELWTNPYYDIAKLSHSVCGNYDFFNTGAYDIQLNKDMKFDLNIEFSNEKYKEIFKDYLEKNGYYYELVRLYEASLFLSMLPLHIDNPKKVLGFILNAINILKEVEGYV